MSSYVADPDPVTTDLVLMGWLDNSLPAVIYPKDEGLSHHQWRHSQVYSPLTSEPASQTEMAPYIP